MAIAISPVLARAQQAPTWEGGRTTPLLGESLAVDATGEADWPFGAEDVAGDGATFGTEEAAVDVRSVYAARGTGQLWLRLYVSGLEEPASEVVGYVFIDADRDPDSGGPADTGASPAFTTDPSAGGYEYFLALPADGSEPTAWEWDGAAWIEGTTPAGALTTEVGIDADPLALGASRHGYLQVAIDYGAVGLNASCTATLFFRTTAVDAVPSDGDLVVGEASPCVGRDANGDRVPDAIDPGACASDQDCPGGGRCVAGECRLPVSCLDDADCANDEECSDGRCVLLGGEDCGVDADCEPLLCDAGTCVPCATDADCGDGACAPDGSCIPASARPGTGGTGPSTTTGGVPGEGGAGDDLVLEPGEEVRGGACTCTLPGGSPRSVGALLALGGLAAVAARRRRQR